MKGSLKYLEAAVIGFALLVGGRVLYDNRDRLKRSWRDIRKVEGLKDLTGDLSVGKILSSVGQIRNLANQFGHIK